MSFSHKSTILEKLLVFVGIFVFVGGLTLVYRTGKLAANAADPVVVIAALMWLILILLMVVAAILENSREGISALVKETAQEIRYVRQISQEQMEEIRLLRQNLKKK